MVLNNKTLKTVATIMSIMSGKEPMQSGEIAAECKSYGIVNELEVNTALRLMVAMGTLTRVRLKYENGESRLAYRLKFDFSCFNT